MRTSKFTVEQISHALRRAEGGVAVAEICRELGITETTFHRWKRKHHGVSAPELRELRQLREECRRLKLALADLTPDRRVLQEALRKTVVRRPSAAR